MMKNGIFLLLCTMVLAACGSKSGGGGDNSNPQVATTSLDQCMSGANPQACNAVNFGNYSQYGFRTYGTAGFRSSRWQRGGYFAYSQQNYNPGTYGYSSNYAAFCSCGADARPVYMPAGGLGCLQSTYFQNFSGLAYYGVNAQNSMVYNSAFQNVQGYNYQSRSCYQAVARACNIGANDCGGGLQCLPTVQNSPIGICATGLANNGYGGNSSYGNGYNNRFPGNGRGHDGRGGGYSSSGTIR